MIFLLINGFMFFNVKYLNWFNGNYIGDLNG